MFVIVFQQLIKMVIIMVIAYICFKMKLVNQEGNKTCSNLLLMVINPCIMIVTFQIDYDPNLARNLIITFVLAIIAHVIAIVMTRLFTRKKNNPEYEVESFAAIYSNCGFIGIPLAFSVFGTIGVFYVTAFMAVFQVVQWTHGIGLMQGGFSLKYLKNGLLSPVMITIAIVLPMYFLQIRLPSLLLESANFIASMNTALAMMVAGFSLAQVDLKSMLKNGNLYRVNLIKLILIPLVTLAVLIPLPVDPQVKYVTLIAIACPTAVSALMFAMRHDKNYKYSSEIFSLSTLFSMATIPGIVFVAGFFF